MPRPLSIVTGRGEGAWPKEPGLPVSEGSSDFTG